MAEQATRQAWIRRLTGLFLWWKQSRAAQFPVLGSEDPVPVASDIHAPAGNPPRTPGKPTTLNSPYPHYKTQRPD